MPRKASRSVFQAIVLQKMKETAEAAAVGKRAWASCHAQCMWQGSKALSLILPFPVLQAYLGHPVTDAVVTVLPPAFDAHAGVRGGWGVRGVTYEGFLAPSGSILAACGISRVVCTCLCAATARLVKTTSQKHNSVQYLHRGAGVLQRFPEAL